MPFLARLIFKFTVAMLLVHRKLQSFSELTTFEVQLSVEVRRHQAQILKLQQQVPENHQFFENIEQNALDVLIHTRATVRADIMKEANKRKLV